MKVSPIQPEHLKAVGQFLHEHLNQRFSAERWISSLTHPWAAQRPNLGMQLHDGDQLVGVFCAIYSDQVIDGRVEHFCNPHSWCVLESHRRHGIGLLLNLIKQPGYHFTMFTPNPTVTQVFRGLKFKDLDDRRCRCINLPSLRALRPGAFAESRRDQVARRLAGQDLVDFEAHRSIPWLEFAVFGAGQDLCWVIYKPTQWKRLRSAWIMHISDRNAFDRHNALLRSHLLLAHGFATLSIESRWLSKVPALALSDPRTQPKLFLSKTLGDAQIRDVYSELMSLDV
ncbi:hypothetical protein [Ideonella sp. A 288]|uniref:hypothetical protein n=1 Tax=Ideonella sp. A 288 TaxID=1962181 RepID=UPI000B4AEAAC|nr:hypothetical protein [Ideonella sp. A 288]